MTVDRHVEQLARDALMHGHAAVVRHEVVRLVYEAEAVRGATYALGRDAHPDIRSSIVLERVDEMSAEQRDAIEQTAIEAALDYLKGAALMVLAGREAAGIAAPPDPATVAMVAMAIAAA